MVTYEASLCIMGFSCRWRWWLWFSDGARLSLMKWYGFLFFQTKFCSEEVTQAAAMVQNVRLHKILNALWHVDVFLVHTLAAVSFWFWEASLDSVLWYYLKTGAMGQASSLSSEFKQKCACLRKLILWLVRLKAMDNIYPRIKSFSRKSHASIHNVLKS